MLEKTTSFWNVRADSFVLVQCTNDNYNRCFSDFSEKHKLTYVSDIYSYYKWSESRTEIHFSVTITPFDSNIYPVTLINNRKELRKKINHAEFWHTKQENNLFYYRKYDLLFQINPQGNEAAIKIIKNMGSKTKTERLIIDDFVVELTTDIEQKQYQKLLIEIIKSYRNYNNRNDNFIDKVAYIFIHSYFRDGDFFKKKHYKIRRFDEIEDVIDCTLDKMLYDNCMVIAPNIFACNNHRKYWIIDYDMQEVFEFTYLSEFLEKKLQYTNKRVAHLEQQQEQKIYERIFLLEKNYLIFNKSNENEYVIMDIKGINLEKNILFANLQIKYENILFEEKEIFFHYEEENDCKYLFLCSSVEHKKNKSYKRYLINDEEIFVEHDNNISNAIVIAFEILKRKVN